MSLQLYVSVTDFSEPFIIYLFCCLHQLASPVDAEGNKLSSGAALSPAFI